MSKKTSSVKVLKNNKSVRALKDASVEFCVFSGDAVEFVKEIDRPDDYYVEGDEITFTIRLKNVGDKQLVDFSMQDEVDDLLPFENGFKVCSTVGQIVSYDKPIKINNITLKPQEEAIIKITGLVGEVE